MKKENIKERIKENFEKNKVFLIVFVVIAVALFLFTINYYGSTIGKQSVGNESYDRSVIELNKETKVVEELPIEENAENVSILFATYARANEGTLHFEVYGVDSNTLYAEKYVDASKVVDNDYITLELSEKLNKSKDKKLRISVSSDSEEGKGVGVYYSNDDWFENSTLLINNDTQENGDLCVKYLVYNEELRNFANIVIASTIVGILLITFIVLLINPKAEILYAIIIFIFGLIMMVIIVPASPPDELSNYEVCLQVSNLMMGEEPYHIDSVYLKYGHMYGHYNISSGYVRFISDIFQPLKLTGNLEGLSRDYAEIYWIQYLPNAIGLTIGRLLKANMITTFYIGRMSGLLFYIVCIYLAIRKAPSFKHLLGMISIMPMFIQAAISITHDTFVLGLSFLIIAYFMNWYFVDKKISIKEFIFVIIISMAIAPAKVLYSFFAFLFIFVPYSRFGSKLKKVLMCLVIIAPSVYQLYGIMKGPLTLFFNAILKFDESNNLILTDTTNNTIGNTVRGTSDTGETEVIQYSFSYMFKHPAEVFDIFARTVRYKIKYWFYGSIGRSLSGETLILPIKLVHVMLIPLLASTLFKQEYTFPVYMKVILVVLCIIIGIYAMVGMFVSWTDSGQTIVDDYGGLIVEGIQGRYFSPLLPYFFVVFANKKIAIPKKFEKYTLLAYLLIFFEVVMYVLSYTFVN